MLPSTIALGTPFPPSLNIGLPPPRPPRPQSYQPPSNVHHPDDDCIICNQRFPSHPRTVPAIPPGFENIPQPSKEPNPPEMDARVALLEKELQIRLDQLANLTQSNTYLSQLERQKAEEVFVLVQELAHCERRTAKAEIAVEYLSERVLQVTAMTKQQEEPDKRILALEDQLEHANRDAETRISVREMEISNLSQENEKLKSKLEIAMDTILSLSSLLGRAQHQGPDSNSKGPDQHNNLIDLMDDCLSPNKLEMPEEHSTTLLGDSYSYDSEDEDVVVKVEPSQDFSELLDSDYSNSSYIVRFKGIRDMTKGAISDDISESPSTKAGSYRHGAPSAPDSGSDGCSVPSRLALLPTPDDSNPPKQSLVTQTQLPLESQLSSSQYGVQFHPAPGESNIFRTVLVSDLPSSTTLLKLLDKVRGGIVFDAKLLNTISITGNYSAMIVFVHERSALAYARYAAENPILFDGLRVKVTVLTPTWPLHHMLHGAITNLKQTRCLEVHDFPKEVSPEMLQRDLQVCDSMITTSVLWQELSQTGVLKLHFPSILLAYKAHWKFSTSKRYMKSTQYYVPDPCDQPLETLESLETLKPPERLELSL